jgi:hypothetical protein
MFWQRPAESKAEGGGDEPRVSCKLSPVYSPPGWLLVCFAPSALKTKVATGKRKHTGLPPMKLAAWLAGHMHDSSPPKKRSFLH